MKKFVPALLFFFILFSFSFFTHQALAAGEFITTWKTDNPGISGDHQITIPTAVGPTYNYNVDWGDSSTSTGQTGNVTHTYASIGTYTVKITGTFPEIFFESGNTSDAQKLLSIEQWGTIHWTSMYKAFAGCANLVINDTVAPDLSGVTNAEYMFLNDVHLNSNLNNWNVSTITDMYGMFQSNLLLNQPFNLWDVSNAQDMGYMFENDPAFNQPLNTWGPKLSNVSNMDSMFLGDTLFNQPLNTWNVSNVTNTARMFSGDAAFNQDLSSWNVSKVTNMYGMFDQASLFNHDLSSWDVSSVTNMGSMFYAAYAFQNGGQPLGWGSKTSHVQDMSSMFNLSPFNQDISGWNVSSVTNLTSMFNADSNFNQDISAWDVSNATAMPLMFYSATAFDQDLGGWNVLKVTDMSGMFTNVALSTVNYDLLLKGWKSTALKSNVTFDAGNSKYCSGNQARAYMVHIKHWTITDGGAVSTSCMQSSGSSGGSTPKLLPIELPGLTDNQMAKLSTTPSTTSLSLTQNSSANIGMPDTPSIPKILGFVFTKNLKKGDKGDDVKALQDFLIKRGAGPASSVLSSAGMTGFFGQLTEKALIEFQKANNITPAVGFFGPKTRAAISN